MMFGKGLDSIRVRFSILIATFSVTATLCVMALDSWVHVGEWSIGAKLALLLAVPWLPAAFTHWMAGRLTRPIEELRRSTEALASGSTEVPIDVDCRCEVGGLADAFRKMVDRFNSNIMRMNVLAYSDAVTQLPNREALKHILEFAIRGQQPFEGAVIFIDLDHFKQVNDTLGHEAGDRLLRAAAERMLWAGFGKTKETLDTCLTPLGEMCEHVPDVLFVRFAGDEFVALVPDLVDKAALAALARRIITSLERPFVINGVEVTVGASVGIARMPADSADPSEILTFADLAMYAAKRSGRSDHAFFNAALRERAMARLDMEAEIRAALERDDVFLEFQPKIRTTDLAVCGVEALARMRSSTGVTIQPGDFIEVAEACGLIERIGDTVLRKAVRQAAEWQREGRNVPIAFNVSPIQFSRPGFAEAVIDTVRASGVDPSLLEVEVTESAAMMDLAATTRRLSQIRAAGIRIAIDDFGTGFSNVSQLVQLPYDVLKIDRTLVSRIGEDPKGETILTGILTIARGLGHISVAEGVETARQFAFLEANGCTTVQGFYFARPMAADQFEAWIDRRSESPDLGRSRLMAL
jgi:two-component system CheB/CheR fusion protein